MIIVSKHKETTMLLSVEGANRIAERVALRAMFAARKRVFVDLLKWDVPVLAGRFEIDQFDDEHARYIILLDASPTTVTLTPYLVGNPTVVCSFDVMVEDLLQMVALRNPDFYEVLGGNLTKAS